MKLSCLFVSAFLFVNTITYAQASSPLVGTWKLISGKLTLNDSTQDYDRTISSIKIITPTHFAVFANRSDSSFIRAAGGPITIDLKNYTETISFGSIKGFFGKKMVFVYDLKGDKWHIDGGGSGYRFEEVWERVK